MPDEQSRFERMMAVVPVALYEYEGSRDDDGRLAYISPHAKEIFELDAEELRRDPAALWTLIHPADREAMRAANRHAIATFSHFDCEVRAITPSGREKWLAFHSRPATRQPGLPPIWVGFIADVSERQRKDQALRRSDDRWRFALEGAGHGVWEWSVETGLVFSKGWKALLGYAENEVANDATEWESRLHPDDRQRVLDTVDAHRRGASGDYEIEYRLRAKDGSYRWILARARITERDAQGVPLQVVGTHTDLTQHKVYEQEIEKLNRVYAALSQVNQAIVRSTTQQQLLDEAVRVLVEYGGFRMAWVGRLEPETQQVLPVASFGHGRDYVSHIRVFADLRPEGMGPAGTCIREQRPVVFNDFLNDERAQVWSGEASTSGFRACASFPLRRGGSVWGNLVVYSEQAGSFNRREVALLEEASLDVAFALDNLDHEEQRRAAERALRESEGYLRLALDAAALGSWRSLGPNLIELDERCRQHHGLSDSRVSLGEIIARLPEEEREGVRTAIVQAMRTDGHFEIEHRTIRPDGKTVWLAVQARAGFEGEGEQRHPAFVIGTTQDITARKRAEQERSSLEAQLLQSQKLESIGRLAGGIAHDFNNLLTIINGYSDLLLAQLDPATDEATSIQQIRKAGGRATSLTRQLLAFSRRQIVDPKPIGLNRLLSESLDSLRRLVGEDVRLVTDLTSESDVVLADAGQLHQVLLNLVVNARDAMPKGGRLSLATHQVELDAASATRLPEARAGIYVVLSVADTGIGMSREVQSHVFEPFFTTKSEGKGTGLGLSTVYGIVRQCEGWITLESHPGQGCRFNIGLPICEQPAEGDEGLPAAAVELHGHETVLLVEDQQEVRRLAAEVLRRYGYRVLDAGSPHAALELANSLSEPIDLLLTDVVMPNMTGKELAVALRATRPGLPVLFMSGYTADLVNRQELRDSGFQFLAKPFSPSELAVMLRRALDPQV